MNPIIKYFPLLNVKSWRMTVHERSIQWVGMIFVRYFPSLKSVET